MLRVSIKSNERRKLVMDFLAIAVIAILFGIVCMADKDGYVKLKKF